MKISWWLTGHMRKNRNLGRDRLMSVNISHKMPGWCRWLTEDTLRNLHDYCWANNIAPEELDRYTDEQWLSLAGQRTGREIIDAVHGMRELEQREREKKALAEKKEQEECSALKDGRQ